LKTQNLNKLIIKEKMGMSINSESLCILKIIRVRYSDHLIIKFVHYINPLQTIEYICEPIIF